MFFEKNLAKIAKLWYSTSQKEDFPTYFQVSRKSGSNYEKIGESPFSMGQNPRVGVLGTRVLCYVFFCVLRWDFLKLLTQKQCLLGHFGLWFEFRQSENKLPWFYKKKLDIGLWKTENIWKHVLLSNIFCCFLSFKKPKNGIFQ